MSPIAVHVVTGFLGAGKTTLINALLREPAMAGTAVLVNEYGEVGIDHALLVRSGAEVVLLEGGCICCAVREGLAATLLDLAERRASGGLPPFERVLIETSGLADPFPIARLLATDAAIASRYRLAQVLSVVDSVRGEALWSERREAAAQLAAADTVWISKAEHAPADSHEPLRVAVQALNAAATVVDGSDPGALERLAGILAQPPGSGPAWATEQRAAPSRSRAAAPVHGWDCACCRPLTLLAAPPGPPHGVRSISLVREPPLRWNVLGAWLEAVVQAAGDALLRVKGIVWVDDGDEPRPWVLQGVQGRLDAPVPWLGATPQDARRHTSRIVLIGAALERSWLEESLAAIEAGESGVTIDAGERPPGVVVDPG